MQAGSETDAGDAERGQFGGRSRALACVDETAAALANTRYNVVLGQDPTAVKAQRVL